MDNKTSLDIDSNILGRIILLQSTLHVQSDEVNMARFLNRGLSSIPGVESFSTYLNGYYVSDANNSPYRVEDCRNLFHLFLTEKQDQKKVIGQYLLEVNDHANTDCIKIETVFDTYGLSLIELSDREAYLPYKPYIENTLNLAALILENNFQKRELLQHKENLEKTVEERTARLKSSHQQLENSVQMLQKEINERKQTEKKLWETQLLLNKAFDNSPIGMLLLRPDGYFHQVNQAFCDIVGYSESEMAQLTFQDLSHQEDHDIGESIFKRLLSGAADKATLQKRYVHKSGEIVHAHLTTTLLKNDEGEPLYFFTQVQNITEQIEAERALKQAKTDLEKKVAERTREFKKAKEEAESANIAKSEFLANISHELRNPMHQILSYSKYGVEKINKPREKLFHYFTQVKKAADRLMVLLNDLLDLSKMESGRMNYHKEPHNLFQIVNETATEFQPLLKDKALKLKIEDPAVPTKIRCDYFKMGQVIRNLLSNAIKFSNNHTSINIAFKSYLFKTQEETIPGVAVSIADQGVGIPEAELDRVFDKFTQSTKTKTGAGGTGLGLAICKEIVKAHGGTIHAENHPRGGAIFTVCIPYHFTVSANNIQSEINANSE